VELSHCEVSSLMVCDKGLTFGMLQIVDSGSQFFVLKCGAICWDSLKVYMGKVNACAIY